MGIKNNKEDRIVYVVYRKAAQLDEKIMKGYECYEKNIGNDYSLYNYYYWLPK